jgi:tRNA-modifying protein YgfZ
MFDALRSTISGVALYDASHWGRIEVSDADRLTFLHNQSTNNLKIRQSGEGCDTVFLSSTARTIDLATAYILDDLVLLTVSPDAAPGLIKVLDRYIFFADKVKLKDVSAETAMFQLIGPESDALVEKLGATALIGKAYGCHQTVTIGDTAVRIAIGNSLSREGYTLIVNAEMAAQLKETIVTHGAVSLVQSDWDELRIRQGRPIPGHELTDEFNPLEAGLWHTISFDKGCYIGQETIARLDSRNAVKQQLWGFQLDQSVETGTAVMVDETKVGQVTSILPSDGGFIGLAYVKTKAGGAGLAVTIGDRSAQLQDLPYLTREKQA